MKKEEDLSLLSSEELAKKAKTAKTATGLLLGIIMVQFAVGIFLTFKQGFNVFTVLPIAFLPLIIVNYVNIKKLNEEIARRNG